MPQAFNTFGMGTFVPAAPTVTFEDAFTDAHAAGAVNATTSTDGTRTRTVTDTNGKMTTAGGRLVMASGGVSTADPGIYYPPVQTRVVGRGVFWTFNTGPTGNIENVGWAGSATPANGLWRTAATAGTQFDAADNGTTVAALSDICLANTDYTCGIIMRTTGAHFVIKGGQFKVWTRFWVSNTGTGNALYPAMTHGTTAVSGVGADLVQQADSIGQWATQYGTADSHYATSTNGQTLTAPVNALVEHTIVAATGVTQELWVRRIDASNGWIVRCNQGSSTVKLIELNAGVETERATAAQTWTNGTSYRIVVLANQQKFRVHVGTTYKFAYLSQTGFASGQTGVYVSHAGTELNTWDVNPTLLVTGTAPTSTIWPYGDSKTFGSGDTVVDGKTGYPPLLVASLTTATGVAWAESPLRIGRPGYTSAMMRALIDKDLTTLPSAPDWILVNLSINDAGGVEATITADMNYILDAMHVKFPSARILLMRVWSSGAPSGGVSMLDDTIYPALVATRPYCALGPDERVFLKGSDNGATYTADGIHPNHAGYVLTAAQWQTAMGY